jgi:acyl carrier protein
VRDELYTFLRDHLSVDTTTVTDDTPLVTSGILDSGALVELIMFLHEAFGLKIEFGDVTIGNFDTIDRVVAFVSRGGVSASG